MPYSPRHRSRHGRRRPAIWLTVLALPAVAVVWLNGSPVTRAAIAARPISLVATRPVAARTHVPAAAGDPVLTADERQACPATATACVDLAARITWLQSGSMVTFGPVRIEPGSRDDPTPRGTFQVGWKVGAHYISTSYDVQIPYAVFFAPGGVGFHAGSLTKPSHGCVHLTLANARYYNEHLHVGAEVVVF